MVHVTQENVGIIDVDLLIHEYIGKDQGKDAFVYIVSPFISDYHINHSRATFTSNVVDVSDVETYVDLVLLLRTKGIPVNIITRLPKDLLRTKLSRTFVETQRKILLKFLSSNCEIRTSTNLHAKATITSHGVLSGSFNLTKSGRTLNLEAGFYFPNTEGVEKEEYESSLAWVKEVSKESHIASQSDLST